MWGRGEQGVRRDKTRWRFQPAGFVFATCDTDVHNALFPNTVLHPDRILSSKISTTNPL